MSWQFVFAVAGIVILDIVLSGDNALVIGAAASRLPRAQRLIAIVWGGAGAIIFRILLTIAATEVLRIQLLQAIGGLLLMVIAIHVLPKGDAEESRFGAGSTRFFTAVLTILIADATMSLDNILAVGALAHGNIPLLVSGLLFSMAVLFIASTLIARLMEVLGWLIDVAAIVIALTAANLFTADPFVHQFVVFDQTATIGIHVGAVAFILLVDVLLRWRARRRTSRASAILSAASEPTADSTTIAANGHASAQNGRHAATEQRDATMLPSATDARASDRPLRAD